MSLLTILLLQAGIFIVMLMVVLYAAAEMDEVIKNIEDELDLKNER